MSEWISIEDRLPNNDNVVLVINKHRVTIARYFGNESWSGRQGKEHRLSTITHWMPLPEPPKEEKVMSEELVKQIEEKSKKILLMIQSAKLQKSGNITIPATINYSSDGKKLSTVTADECMKALISFMKDDMNILHKKEDEKCLDLHNYIRKNY